MAAHSRKYSRISFNNAGVDLKSRAFSLRFHVYYFVTTIERIGKLTTKTVHSEVVYNFSAMKSISSAFKAFGLSDENPTLLIAVVTTPKDNPREQLKHIRSIVHGAEVTTFT